MGIVDVIINISLPEFKKKAYEIPPEFEKLWNMKLVNGFSSMKVEHTWRMRDKSTIHVYAI